MIDQRLAEIAVAPLDLADKDQMVAGHMPRQVVALKPGRAFRFVEHEGSARAALQRQAVEAAGLRPIGETLRQLELSGEQSRGLVRFIRRGGAVTPGASLRDETRNAVCAIIR